MKILQKWKSPFLVGALISLAGTLPFGVLNILTFKIGTGESVVQAGLFATGVVLSEMIIVAACLKWFRTSGINPLIIECLRYLMIAFIFYLAIQEIVQIGSKASTHEELLKSPAPRFLLGMMLSAVNPSQFPFWIAWNTVLKEQGLLSERNARNKYLIGIGCGTFLGLACFIACSQLIDDASGLLESPAYHLIIACLFASIGILILFKSFWKRWYSNGWR